MPTSRKPVVGSPGWGLDRRAEANEEKQERADFGGFLPPQLLPVSLSPGCLRLAVWLPRGQEGESAPRPLPGSHAKAGLGCHNQAFASPAGARGFTQTLLPCPTPQLHHLPGELLASNPQFSPESRSEPGIPQPSPEETGTARR